MAAMSLLQRARASGRIPPVLLREDTEISDGFDEAVFKVLDGNELALSNGIGVVDDFSSLMQMAGSTSVIQGDIEEQKKSILVQRRCIILAIVGSTPSSNNSLARILSSGFLSTVKQWMDDILNGSVGGVDLLLHLLSNIINLPVTKAVVKESGMGRAIGSIEKHKMFAGTPNEGSVKERVTKIKSAWNKSVKALKEKESSSADTRPAKREIDASEYTQSPTAKKAKVEDPKKSFSSLLKRVTVPKIGKPGAPASPSESTKKNKETTSLASLLGSDKTKAATGSNSNNKDTKKVAQKKSLKRVKWSDHFGGTLTASKILEGDDGPYDDEEQDSSVSWSDRKKRDRLREKELLAQAKKSKLLDDDDDLGMDLPRPIQPTTPWHAPTPLPPRSDVAAPQLNSSEVNVQTTRMASVTPVRYISDSAVPSSPKPLSDVEQALDMTSQSSTVSVAIPFFVPQAPPAPAPAPAVAPAPALATPYSQPGMAHSALPGTNMGMSMPPSQPQPGPGLATAETVQSLGLPMFLVGQNTQALQTLASTPSLLSTFVDSNGMYDQTRLMSLVQTLSQNIAPSQHQTHNNMGQFGGGIGGYQQDASQYGSTGQHQPYQTGGQFGAANTGTYGHNTGSMGSFGGGSRNNGFRGDMNGGEGNLHVSGFGPTTSQSEIITLFSPYVHVDEVVMKGTFCFVNTSDAVGAKRAREALNGAHLGGQPIRINIAQRKARDNSNSMVGGTPGQAYGGNTAMRATPRVQPSVSASGGAIDFENVRDDRGNPVTKNLFVAGYGPGTTEVQLREIFEQHAKVIGVIVKGTFSFVNTSDRQAAVNAREALTGTMLNGGVLRINFAKETGRLGTSFDLTYGSQANGGAPVGGASHSHYGRF